jgi:hypothetical protein
MYQLSDPDQSDVSGAKIVAGRFAVEIVHAIQGLEDSCLPTS